MDIHGAIGRFRWAPPEPRPDRARPSKLLVARPPRRRWWPRPLAKYRPPRQYALDWDPWDLPDERDQRDLSELVIPDLPVIASTRLLGKHPDTFSAVDRDRAEVDFRLAVIPPVLALAIAVASHEPGDRGLLIAAVGGAIVVGLLLDAIHQQRQAYDLLLDLLQVNEITAPSLERLETWVADRADKTPSKTLARRVEDMSRAIRTFLGFVVIGSLSTPVDVLTEGADRLAQARQELAAIKALPWQALPPATVELAERLLDRLDRINRQWRGFNMGAVDEYDDHLRPERVEVDVLAGELDAARQELTTLTGLLADALVDATNRYAASRAATGEPPAEQAPAGAP